MCAPMRRIASCRWWRKPVHAGRAQVMCCGRWWSRCVAAGIAGRQLLMSSAMCGACAQGGSSQRWSFSGRPRGRRASPANCAVRRVQTPSLNLRHSCGRPLSDSPAAICGWITGRSGMNPIFVQTRWSAMRGLAAGRRMTLRTTAATTTVRCCGQSILRSRRAIQMRRCGAGR